MLTGSAPSGRHKAWPGTLHFRLFFAHFRFSISTTSKKRVFEEVPKPDRLRDRFRSRKTSILECFLNGKNKQKCGRVGSDLIFGSSKIGSDF